MKEKICNVTQAMRLAIINKGEVAWGANTDTLMFGIII
jgi:hypothetical protein